jgi:hypothetical protein
MSRHDPALGVLWDTVTDDLPRLIGELKSVVPPEAKP